MRNATELFKSSGSSDKQGPGNWIRRKEVKKVLDKYGDKLMACHKDAEGQWLFDDRMFDLYSQYITPKEKEVPAEVKQINESQEWYDVLMQSFKKETNEEVYEYLFRKALEDLLQINYVKLSKLGVKDPWKDATPPVKKMLASYISVCRTRLDSYNKRVDTHFMDSIRMEFSKILERGEILRVQREYFSNDECKVFLDNRMNLVSKPHEK